MRYASSGVSGAGLMMIVQPDSSAGASLAIVTNCGTFHGTMPATTPTGSCRTMTSVPSMPVRVSSHGNCCAMPTKVLSIIHAAGAWPRFENVIGEPISAVMISAISGRRAA